MTLHGVACHRERSLEVFPRRALVAVPEFEFTQRRVVEGIRGQSLAVDGANFFEAALRAIFSAMAIARLRATIGEGRMAMS